ncbi:hypothetical protein BTO20_00840 [Mycobacterium dioxanotrophicus]|uniref:GrpB family protein n=2 Tax=Mycobacterium dioxanotrophicus TaxID=482462 RepID=A0A1Y0BWR5_9MYCO|nr:hypothetical protein BTO20_00840 [Mycobacterium dioxanotrophicus]
MLPNSLADFAVRVPATQSLYATTSLTFSPWPVGPSLLATGAVLTAASQPRPISPRRATDSPWSNWATETIEIVDADPDWEAQGKRLCDNLQALLAPWLVARIEHVGSTAIPGLPAKPIIDLQAAVAHLDASDSMAAVLSKHDWHYVTPDLDRRPWRRFFVKVNEGHRSAHLHIMTTDSARWHQQIAFRDALRADPSTTANYAALKRSLAAEHGDDREAYSAAKYSFIQAVLNARSD